MDKRGREWQVVGLAPEFDEQGHFVEMYSFGGRDTNGQFVYRLSPSDVAKFRGLPELKRLNLTHIGISDREIVELRGARSLETLVLVNTDVNA
jgi:hypothetical protein